MYVQSLSIISFVHHLKIELSISLLLTPSPNLTPTSLFFRSNTPLRKNSAPPLPPFFTNSPTPWLPGNHRLFAVAAEFGPNSCSQPLSAHLLAAPSPLGHLHLHQLHLSLSQFQPQLPTLPRSLRRHAAALLPPRILAAVRTRFLHHRPPHFLLRSPSKSRWLQRRCRYPLTPLLLPTRSHAAIAIHHRLCVSFFISVRSRNATAGERQPPSSISVTPLLSQSAIATEQPLSAISPPPWWPGTHRLYAAAAPLPLAVQQAVTLPCRRRRSRATLLSLSFQLPNLSHNSSSQDLQSSLSNCLFHLPSWHNQQSRLLSLSFLRRSPDQPLLESLSAGAPEP